ncbi:MAG: M6 family metalloprotease domain-containing protein [Fibrobacter sp.]|nr:M6 family metalloprotease domain-containing protein [Fibrobacter sp.]
MSLQKYLLISSLVGSVSAWAISAAPFPINSVQPDGSILQIRKIGNEHFNYTVTDEDSVLIVRDTTGYWHYADEHGKKTGMRAHAKSKRGSKEKNFLKKRNSRQILEKFREHRLKKLQERREQEESEESQPMMLQSAPMKANEYGWGGWTTETQTSNTNAPTRPVLNSVRKEGDVRGLVVLVQFSDVKFKRNNAQEEYIDFLNKEGYSNYFMNGSARDFFILNSSGKYRPTFDVAGPITLKKTRDEYGSAVNPNNIATGAVNALSEAMDSLVAQNVDFTPYDSDGDKVIDFVYMIYAGVGSADTDVQTAIWPHSYNLPKRLTRNISMNRYACSAEIDGQSYSRYSKNTDALNGIGTFCHEFSHVLGLQDHYDVNVNDTRTKVRFTPGMWDLMDAGSYNCPQNKYLSTSCSPANLSAFERFSLGWLEPKWLEISDTTTILNAIQENDALVLTSNNDNEYYFIDFRLKEDFDVGLPNKGMLIWHINYDKKAWVNNMLNTADPLRVDLVEADGKADNYTIPNDAFPTNRVNSFNGFVTWNGDSLGLEIYDIKIVDDHVEFKTRGSRVTPKHPSSSSKAEASSSSVKKSSSSIANSSASVSSSSIAISSSTAKSSSSIARPFSSSNRLSSSSNSSHINPGISSSSDHMQIQPKTNVILAVQFSVENKVLKLNTSLEGRKTLNLFDANGTLLMTNSFKDKACEIQLNKLRGKSFVIATLNVNGKPIKTQKIRVGF